MTQKEKLIELIQNFLCKSNDSESLPNYLLDYGVVVLPCKVGDSVYKTIASETPFVDKGMVKSISYDGKLWSIYSVYDCGLTWWSFLEHDLGKDIFLTREEAEAALKGEKNE